MSTQALLGTFLLGALATAPEVDSAKPPPPPQAVRQVLAQKQFQFCHATDYPLTPAEKNWCDLGAGENTEACPTLGEICKHEALARQFELREPIAFHLPELGLPMRLLLWILLGLGMSVLVFAWVRHFLDRKAKQDVVSTQPPGAAEDEARAALARQVETDVQRLLERARAEAAAGDFRNATSDAYAALLRRFEGAGVLRIEPHKTNGDYLCRVKSERPYAARRMEDVVHQVEVAQFGDRAVTAESFDSVFARVMALLSERIGVWLVLGSALLWATACGMPRDDWDHSPSGRAGVIAYLAKRGFKVHERLLSLTHVGEGKFDQIVLLPGARLVDEDWKNLLVWLGLGHHSLVIAGGRHTLPEWVGMRIVEKPVSTSESIVPSEFAAKHWGKLEVRVPATNQLEYGKANVVLLGRTQGAYAAQRWNGVVNEDDEDDEGDEGDENSHEGEMEAEAKVDNGGQHAELAPGIESADHPSERNHGGDDGVANRVLVLADDFLFRNASLLVADNATALDHLLREGGTSLELVGDLTGLVSTNPVESVERGRLGPALLQILAFALLLFVARGARFGRAVHTEHVVRRSYLEHVRALALHYGRARAERQALALMGAYAVERLRERLGMGTTRSLSGLAEAVALRTGRSVGEVMRILIEARDASKGVPADKGARDLDTVAELCKLLEETGGSGGQQPISAHL